MATAGCENLSNLGLWMFCFLSCTLALPATLGRLQKSERGIDPGSRVVRNVQLNNLNDSTGSSNSSLLMSNHLLSIADYEDNPTYEPCSNDDIIIGQGAAAPLPSGIPTYSVHIMNACVEGCSICNIHVSCGWFSSARLIDPAVFKRVSYNDCLVNGGNPLPAGQAVSFQYADSYPYPLSVSSVMCC